MINRNIKSLLFWLQVEGKEAESVPPYKRFTKNIANKSAVSATEEFQDASEPSTSGDLSTNLLNLYQYIKFIPKVQIMIILCVCGSIKEEIALIFEYLQYIDLGWCVIKSFR